MHARYNYIIYKNEINRVKNDFSEEYKEVVKAKKLFYKSMHHTRHTIYYIVSTVHNIIIISYL
jgi:hypothetical protein